MYPLPGHMPPSARLLQPYSACAPSIAVAAGLGACSFYVLHNLPLIGARVCAVPGRVMGYHSLLFFAGGGGVNGHLPGSLPSSVLGACQRRVQICKGGSPSYIHTYMYLLSTLRCKRTCPGRRSPAKPRPGPTGPDGGRGDSPLCSCGPEGERVPINQAPLKGGGGHKEWYLMWPYTPHGLRATGTSPRNDPMIGPRYGTSPTTTAERRREVVL
ncbi:hypothetical protein DFP73DRAFT_267760 [Morchella snyderi]|nr:hypothetical protein DFP73DRAFT_267760 [Morchella snyderi]